MNASSDIQEGLFVEYIVFCESASKELSGKDVLVGITPGGLMAPTFPMRARCAFWYVIRAVNAPGGIHNVSVRLRAKGESAKDIIKIDTQFEVPDGASGRNAFFTPAMDVTISEPVVATLSWSIDASEYIVLRDIEFVQGPNLQQQNPDIQ